MSGLTDTSQSELRESCPNMLWVVKTVSVFIHTGVCVCVCALCVVNWQNYPCCHRPPTQFVLTQHSHTKPPLKWNFCAFCGVFLIRCHIYPVPVVGDLIKHGQSFK